jgi:hypothetical protein
MTEEEKKPLSKDEVIAWYKEQIEVATLRADLAEQQARAVKHESERLQHAAMIANITASVEQLQKEAEQEEAEASK